ncbi:argininosuccinate lyase [Chelatococcus sp. SYSU_G07232]|uniref:Argininosuccinate lyase n=1 Tax=Chelatococcus albus TaxID=3047466 RepID=A0ABT7AKX4_9HYPH|nr:argininosuccinate lyase [Chelatococcus sp. SYSU_G07232]MDJ1160036.1 argininosuccinate lyase [Chelatococcus sp. SYSU_G07232]
MASTTDPDRFPAPAYKAEVLAPLFEGVKQHHWRHQMRINRASALMLAEVGVLTRREAIAILAALDSVEREVDVPALVYTGEHEDFFFLVEAELKKRLGADLAGKLHTGRSRNDIDHTVFKMALKERLAALLGDLLGAVAALIEVAEAQRATLVVAYTHGQPAQPTTFGHYLAAIVEVLLRDVERLRQAARYPDLSSMGAAAITTSGFPLDRAMMARLLGFSGVQENSYGAIAACDYISSVYGATRLLFVHLGRFVQDLNSWTGFEVGHLVVPDAYVQISSIMPQKRNPVVVEHLRLLSSLAAGRADTMIQALHNTPFTDMNDSEGEVQAAGYAAFEAGGRALRLLTDFIRLVSIDEARVRAHIEASCVTMTELADSLVRSEGLSFRQAHEVASDLARRMIAAGETPSKVGFPTFRAVFAAVVGREPAVTEADFRRFLTPEHFIAVRDRFGGPAPAALAASLARCRDELDEARRWLDGYAGRIAAVDATLAAARHALTQD